MRKVFKKKYFKTYSVFLFLGLLIFGALFYLKFVTNDNNKENKKETADDIRVAAVGDSITYDRYSAAR